MKEQTMRNPNTPRSIGTSLLLIISLVIGTFSGGCASEAKPEVRGSWVEVKEYELEDNVIAPEEDTRFKSVQVKRDALVFDYDGHAPLGIGQVVAGSGGGGYIRIIDSLAPTADGRVEAKTRNGSFDDVFKKAIVVAHYRPQEGEDGPINIGEKMEQKSGDDDSDAGTSERPSGESMSEADLRELFETLRERAGEEKFNEALANQIIATGKDINEIIKSFDEISKLAERLKEVIGGDLDSLAEDVVGQFMDDTNDKTWSMKGKQKIGNDDLGCTFTENGELNLNPYLTPDMNMSIEIDLSKGNAYFEGQAKLEAGVEITGEGRVLASCHVDLAKIIFNNKKIRLFSTTFQVWIFTIGVGLEAQPIAEADVEASLDIGKYAYKAGLRAEATLTVGVKDGEGVFKPETIFAPVSEFTAHRPGSVSIGGKATVGIRLILKIDLWGGVASGEVWAKLSATIAPQYDLTLEDCRHQFTNTMSLDLDIGVTLKVLGQSLLDTPFSKNKLLEDQYSTSGPLGIDLSRALCQRDAPATCGDRTFCVDAFGEVICEGSDYQEVCLTDEGEEGIRNMKCGESFTSASCMKL